MKQSFFIDSHTVCRLQHKRGSAGKPMVVKAKRRHHRRNSFGRRVECHFALYNLLKDDKVKHIPWSEMLSSLTGKSVKSRYLQLTVGYRFNL